MNNPGFQPARMLIRWALSIALLFALLVASPVSGAVVDLSNNLGKAYFGAVSPSGGGRVAQSFKTTAQHYLAYVGLPLCKENDGETGNFRLDIYKVDAWGLPGDFVAPVASRSIDSIPTVYSESVACPVVDFPVSPRIDLAANTEYYLVVYTTSANFFYWDFSSEESGVGFPSKYAESPTSGLTWFGPYMEDPQIMRIIADDAPTAVELSGFAATERDGSIALTWQTTSQSDLVGFHVYRAETVDGPRTRLTESPLAIGSGEFIDQAAVPGVTYWYWLETIDGSGATMLYGPEAVASSFRVFVPLVNRR